jgi:RNA polymerase sigma factor (sigma-70 family)
MGVIEPADPPRVLVFSLHGPGGGASAGQCPLEPSDEAAIEAVLAGEREAFGPLLDRHGPVLWALVRRRVADPEQAREVYQEAVVRGFERLGELREPGRLRSWWLSIALNLVRDRGRERRASGEELEDGGWLLELPDPGPAVGAEQEQREEAERLRAALAELPPRQREVCRLRLVDELSHGAIAELLQISEEASRAHLHQALKRLRQRREER